MKKSALLFILILSGAAQADYGIRPVPKTRPGTGYGTQPVPETRPGGGTTIGNFERRQQIQRLVDDVLWLAESTRYRDELIGIALRERETVAYLAQLQAHFRSPAFKRLSERERQGERFKARAILEIIVRRGSLR